MTKIARNTIESTRSILLILVLSVNFLRLLKHASRQHDSGDAKLLEELGTDATWPEGSCDPAVRARCLSFRS